MSFRIFQKKGPGTTELHSRGEGHMHTAAWFTLPGRIIGPVSKTRNQPIYLQVFLYRAFSLPVQQTQNTRLSWSKLQKTITISAHFTVQYHSY